MTREERREFEYWQNRRIVDDKIEKLCTQCKEWKVESEHFYYKNKTKPELGFVPECKECAKKRARKWSLSNNDKCRESYRKNRKTQKRKDDEKARHQRRVQDGYFKDYQQTHAEQINQYSKNHRNHSISEREWQDCLKTFDYKCAYCGATEEEHKQKYNQRLHKDHVEHDGANDLRNAVPACKRCNSYKWQHDMETWFKEQEFFNKERLEFIKWWMTEEFKRYIKQI